MNKYDFIAMSLLGVMVACLIGIGVGMGMLFLDLIGFDCAAH